MHRPFFRIHLGFFPVTSLLISALLFSAFTVLAQNEMPASTDDPVQFFEKGQDEHAMGNFQNAIDFYDQALKVLPEFAEAEYQKNNAYLSLGKKSEAESAFRRAIGLR